MRLRVATPELVSDRVRTVLEDRPHAEVIALRAEPQWREGPLEVGDRRVEVVPCHSPLAVRAALAAWTDGNDGALLVLLFDFEQDLGADVLARLSPPRVLSLEPWDAARALFGVRRVDAAFGKDDGWIAGALLAHVPPEVAREMTGGSTLTVEAAHDALAGQLLGADALGVDAVVVAAGSPRPFERLDGLDPDTRSGLLRALARRDGNLGALVADILGAGRGPELLAIGLAARAVYGHGDHDGGRAAGLLEARCGSQRIAPAVGAALAQRCEEAVRTLLATDSDRAQGVIADAARLTTELGAADPEASTLLPQGYARRIAVAVAALDTFLDATGATPGDARSADAAFEPVRAALDVVDEHRERETKSGRRRYGHLEMAARLAAWSATPAPDASTRPASFEAAAFGYARSGAWVDRARRRLWRGDHDHDVAVVYRTVIDRVVERRRTENRRFAELLASWTTTPSSAEALGAHALTTVEDVADTVLARLGDTGVLFVVLDGCGLATFGELAPQFRDAGFREIAPVTSAGGPDGAARRLTAIAALPTVTEVSRASLLAGRLDRGNQDHERRQFEANPSLRRAGRPAALFHQNKLLGAAGEALSAEVRRALDAEGPGVVGVVINTIDDELQRGVFPEEHRLDDLTALVSLLDVARDHGRAVVVSADHGHVLAQPDDGGTGTFLGGGSGGERWREADRPPGETEVVLRGPRVRLGGDAGILAPWEDDFRYGAKAGGYHGGATPEEVLVPVAVYLPAGSPMPDGWQDHTEVVPLWWDLKIDGGTPGVGAAGRDVPAPKPRRKPTKRHDDAQATMFDLPTPEPTPAPAVAPAAAPRAADQPGWIDDLLASEVWTVQKAASGRASLPDERVRATLAAIARRGGVTSYPVLAAEAGMPLLRLGGFLAHLARVLNVDGYAVLDLDAKAQEVRLSMPTLGQQFQIDVEER